MTPLLAMLAGLAVAVLAALGLSDRFGAPGIAAAIALAAWCSAAVLMIRSKASFGFALDRAARRRLPLIVLAALAMGGSLWLATHWLPGTVQPHSLARAALLAVLIAGGLLIYAALLTLSGAVRWSELRGALRSAPARR
jgi:putative peptidoglycan lipid II flippase